MKSLMKIEVWHESEDTMRKLYKELKERGFIVAHPYYTNGYGAPINYAGPSAYYPAPTEGEIDGE